MDAITSNTTTTADTLASYPEISYFVAGQCLHLVENDCLEVAEWTAGIVPYLSLFMSKDDSSKVAPTLAMLRVGPARIEQRRMSASCPPL